MSAARLDLGDVRPMVATYPTVCVDVAAEIRNVLCPIVWALGDDPEARESVARLLRLADALMGTSRKANPA